MAKNSEKRRQGKSDKLALEEMSEGVEPVAPLPKGKVVWLPKLGDVLKIQPTRER